MAFFANLFGYVLKFLYDIVNNYGIAIILFSILVKLVMIPITAKQQKTLKKNQKIQEEMKQIQFKFKNDPEKLNQEIMALYKREGMSPLSGCFSSIIQFILLISVFLLVRSPLTYMVKINPDAIKQMENIVIGEEENKNNRYTEIAIIQYVRNLENGNSVVENDNKEEFNIDEYKEKVNLNMDLFGIDLSQVPTQNPTDWKVLAIPVLYVISSFISIKLTTLTGQNKKKNGKKMITDGTEENKEEYNPMQDASKTMTWMMPFMAISIAIIAPLGLALYWLMNNILMILERLIFDKIINKEEAEENA